VLDIVLDRCAVLEGWAITDDGIPIVGREVTIAGVDIRYEAPTSNALHSRVPELQRDRPTLLRAGLDANGHYEFRDVMPGSYIVWLSRGSQDAVLGERWRQRAAFRELPDPFVRVSVAPGERSRIDLTEPAPATLGGRVTVCGDIASDAIVLVTYADESYHSYGRVVVATTRTDDSGQYSFESMSPGEYLVLSGVVGQTIPERYLCTLHEGEQRLLDITFCGETLDGVVLDKSTRRPVPGLVVSVDSNRWPIDDDTKDGVFPGVFAGIIRNLAPEFGMSVRCGMDGRFAITNVEPSRLILGLEDDIAYSISLTASGAGYSDGKTLVSFKPEWRARRRKQPLGILVSQKP